MKTLAIFTLAAATVLAAGPVAAAEEFPQADKPMRIVVPFAAGGGVDSAARLLAEKLRHILGTNVLVENKGGASGTLGGRFVQTSPADGYTLLFSASTHIFAKDIMANAPYDPITDFAAVAKFGEAPLLLIVSPQVGKTTLKDVIATAKAAPQKWTAALPAFGAPSHLGTLLFADKAKLDMQYVAYKGTQPAAVDVAGGHVQMLFDSVISLAPLAKAGRVVPIAISSPKRSDALPQVPTFAEGGLDGVTYMSWYGVWAPKGTPADRVAKLNTAVNRAATELAASGSLESLGLHVTPMRPEEFEKQMREEQVQGRELLKRSGFKAE